MPLRWISRPGQLQSSGPDWCHSFAPVPANTPDSNNHLIVIFSLEWHLINQLCLLGKEKRGDTNQALEDWSCPGLWHSSSGRSCWTSILLTLFVGVVTSSKSVTNMYSVCSQGECHPDTCTQMTATEQWIFLCAAHKTPKEVRSSLPTAFVEADPSSSSYPLSLV
jgi:hypothetical protein